MVATIPPKRRRAKRRSEKCDSCRRLKISCDKLRPSCEYCSATGRQCVYEIDSIVSTVKSITPREFSNTTVQMQVFDTYKDKMAEMAQSQFLAIQSLNDTATQLGLSRFEFKLIKFFNDFYLKRAVECKQLDESVEYHIPYAWQVSPLVRRTIYTMSCMFLYGLCDGGQKYLVEDMETPMDPHELYVHTVYYFQECIQTIQSQLEQIAESQMIVKDVDQAVEVILTCVLLFLFLVIQPFKILPLISFHSSSDIIGLCRGLKVTMIPSFDLLRNTNFEQLVQLCNILGEDKGVSREFPSLKHLNNEFDLIRSEIDPEDVMFYEHALCVLNSSFEYGIKLQNASLLYRWLFLLKARMYALMKDKQYFALKLLGFYACLGIFAGLTMGGTSEGLLEYLEFYKQFNFDTFGGWKDDFDWYCYRLALQSYRFPGLSLNALETFMPQDYVIDDDLYNDRLLSGLTETLVYTNSAISSTPNISSAFSSATSETCSISSPAGDQPYDPTTLDRLINYSPTINFEEFSQLLS